MLGEEQEFLQTIFKEIQDSTTSGSVNQDLNVIGLAYSMDLSLSETLEDRLQETRHLSAAGAMACMKLREAMYQPGKGTWYTARFTIDAAGNCDVRYDYDSMPANPTFNETVADIHDLLVEDHERFPRDQEHLPEWHPSRT